MLGRSNNRISQHEYFFPSHVTKGWDVLEAYPSSESACSCSTDGSVSHWRVLMGTRQEGQEGTRVFSNRHISTQKTDIYTHTHTLSTYLKHRDFHPNFMQALSMEERFHKRGRCGSVQSLWKPSFHLNVLRSVASDSFHFVGLSDLLRPYL